MRCGCSVVGPTYPRGRVQCIAQQMEATQVGDLVHTVILCRAQQNDYSAVTTHQTLKRVAGR